MSSPVTPAPREPAWLAIRPPHPLWLGLATCVLVVAYVALRFGVPLYRQHVAIREIERIGGSVDNTEPGGPEWLRNRLGDEWMRPFDRVTNVDLTATGANNETLAHVKGLTDLQVLWLNGTQVTDAGLARLTGLTALHELTLDSTQMTDAGLVHLKGLTDLQVLWLNGTQVTDAGLARLTGLTALHELTLDSTQVTDAGLVHLKGLTGLKFLGISGTKVTDAGVTELTQALPNLEVTR